MKLKIFTTQPELVAEISEMIIATVEKKPTSVICIAGGDTPMPVMEKLVAAQQENKVDFSKAFFLGLDEWVGLGSETKGSCIQTLQDNLFQPLHLKAEQIVFFDGKGNLAEEVQRVNQFVASHGIDFILLGVGMNGHVGFNEPGVNIESNVQVVDLDAVTTKVMAKYFEKDLPLTQGITLGFQQILAARQIVLMATGEKKAEIVKATLENAATSAIPSTILKTAIQPADFFVDAAAGKLVEEDYNAD